MITSDFMELYFACPQCGSENRIDRADENSVIDCARCSYVGVLPPDWADGEQVELCPICGSRDLYRQRDFHQKTGVVIALIGTALALITRFLSLVAAGVLDLVLYFTASERLVCYRCHSLIRGHRPSPRHRRYDSRLDRRIREEVESPRT